eukprot:6214462-Pleurochrysis_carterae.AAC.10
MLSVASTCVSDWLRFRIRADVSDADLFFHRSSLHGSFPVLSLPIAAMTRPGHGLFYEHNVAQWLSLCTKPGERQASTHDSYTLSPQYRAQHVSDLSCCQVQQLL